MAISYVLKDSGTRGFDTSEHVFSGLTTASMSFTSGNLVLVWMGGVTGNNTTDDTTPEVMTVSASGWTFTRHANAYRDAAYVCTHTFFVAPVPSTGSIAFTMGTITSAFYVHYAVWEITGAHSTPVGAKVQPGIVDGTTDGSRTITLNATPASSSVVFAGMQMDAPDGSGRSVTPGTGWTELLEINVDAEYGYSQIQARTASTSTSVTWNDVSATNSAYSFGGSAVEIVAGAGGTNATATPSVVTKTPSVPAPTVTAGGSASTSPAVVTKAISVPAPTVATGTRATPAVITVSATVLAASTSQFPFPASRSGRLILDQFGEPWQIHGDAGWSSSNISVTDLTTYLDGLVTTGHNAFICDFMTYRWNENSPAGSNDNGDVPFVGTWFQSNIDDDYWDHIELLLTMAEDRGLTVFGVAAYCGANDGEGLYGVMVAADNTEMETYGAQIATRLLEHINLVWLLGGDRWFLPGVEDEFTDPTGQIGYRYDAMAEGIRSVDTSHLWMGFTGNERSSIEQFGPGTGYTTNLMQWWNTTYVYDADLIDWQESAWNEASLPVCMFEGHYSNETTGSGPPEYRRMLWLGCLTHGGHFAGHNEMWNFEQVAIYAGRTPWQDCLTEPEMEWVTVCWDFFNTHDWSSMTPDFGTTFLTTGIGSAGNRAAVGHGDELAVLWFPNSRSITVNLAPLTPTTINARWLDPTDGSSTAIGSYATTGSQSFTHPGNTANSIGEGDFVLVLDTALSATATPAVVTVTVTVLAPTVTAATNATATPAATSRTVSVPAPTVGAGAGVTLSVVTTTATVPAPTVTAGGSASTTPAVVTVTATAPAPTVTVASSATTTPAVVTVTATVLTVTATSSTTATPAVVTRTPTVPAPSISAGGSANTTPDPATRTVSVPTPTVAVGSRATPAVVTVTPAVLAPASVSAGADILVTAPVVTITTTVPAAIASTSITPPIVTITAAVLAVALRYGQTVSAPVVTVTGSALAASAGAASGTSLPHVTGRRPRGAISGRPRPVIKGDPAP